MKQAQVKRDPPDIDAAVRGRDWTQPVNGEVELITVPVVVVQAERLRHRLYSWEVRVHEINGAVKSKRGRGLRVTT